jgi:hypothetical protein
VAVLIRRLEEQDEVESFDCSDEPLNKLFEAPCLGKSAEELTMRHTIILLRRGENCFFVSLQVVVYDLTQLYTPWRSP